mgnify:CR=1 FL=1
MYKLLPILLFAYGLAVTTEDIKSMLVDKFHFQQDNIVLLKNEEATKTSIIQEFSNITKKAESNDRVLIFFAGHGQTQDLPDGGEMGYLLPVDGDADNLYISSIGMDELKKISSMSLGININNLRREFIESLRFLLPPLNEQKRIVSKIEELFSKIDSTKQSLEHTKLQLYQYRHSLLKSAFEGKLVNSNSKDDEKILDLLKIIENERKDEILKHFLKNRKSKVECKFQEDRKSVV